MIEPTATAQVWHPETLEELQAICEQHPESVCLDRDGDRGTGGGQPWFDRYAPWTVVLLPPRPEPLPEWAANDVCMIQEGPVVWWRFDPSQPWHTPFGTITTTDLVEQRRGRGLRVIARFEVTP